MKNKLKRLLYSDGFVIVGGMIVIPILSFILISVSPESPLYTSISRIAWVHHLWPATFIWAIIVMSLISWLTYRMADTCDVVEGKGKVRFLTWQLVSIVLVFTGCLMFPAKQSIENVNFVNYIHDYLTTIAWVMYAAGLAVYSIRARRRDKLLGLIGMSLMGFIVFSSLYFLSRIIDPKSYVGASAISEVYIINNLSIYLVVMYVAQRYMRRSESCIPKELLT